MNSGNKHNRSVIVALTLALALTAGSGAVEAAGKRAPTGSGGGGSIQSFIDWCLGNGKGKTFSGGQFICACMETKNTNFVPGEWSSALNATMLDGNIPIALL